MQPLDEISRQRSFCEQPYKRKVTLVANTAADAIEKAFPGEYDTEDVIAEPVSHKKGDWYLWIIAARKKLLENGRPSCSAWTMNLTTGDLNGGSYDLTEKELNDAIAKKKSYDWAVKIRE